MCKIHFRQFISYDRIQNRIYNFIIYVYKNTGNIFDSPILRSIVRQYEREIHLKQHTSSVECKFLTLARAVDLA